MFVISTGGETPPLQIQTILIAIWIRTNSVGVDVHDNPHISTSNYDLSVSLNMQTLSELLRLKPSLVREGGCEQNALRDFIKYRRADG